MKKYLIGFIVGIATLSLSLTAYLHMPKNQSLWNFWTGKEVYVPYPHPFYMMPYPLNIGAFATRPDTFLNKQEHILKRLDFTADQFELVCTKFVSYASNRDFTTSIIEATLTKDAALKLYALLKSHEGKIFSYTYKGIILNKDYIYKDGLNFYYHHLDKMVLTFNFIEKDWATMSELIAQITGEGIKPCNDIKFSESNPTVIN